MTWLGEAYREEINQLKAMIAKGETTNAECLVCGGKHFTLLEDKTCQSCVFRGRIAELESELDADEDKLHRIGNWANAYPEFIFTPPTEGDLQTARERIGPEMCTKLHADWGRYILKGVREILDGTNQ